VADLISILRQLRDRIPDMKCVPGCTQCCGHVPWSRFEWLLLPTGERRKHDDFTFLCPHATERGCRVYEHRPLVCRMTGVSEGIPCPRGVPVDATISKEIVVSITKVYQERFFEGGQIP